MPEVVLSAESAIRAIERGVDFIITDRPAAVGAELEDIREKQPD